MQTVEEPLLQAAQPLRFYKPSQTTSCRGWPQDKLRGDRAQEDWCTAGLSALMVDTLPPESAGPQRKRYWRGEVEPSMESVEEDRCASCVHKQKLT